MNYIKSFKIFESHYNKEEFIDFVLRELSKYQITPLKVKNILSKYENEMQTKSEEGENPFFFAKKLIDDLELDGGKGALAVNFSQPNNPSQIKYL